MINWNLNVRVIIKGRLASTRRSVFLQAREEGKGAKVERTKRFCQISRDQPFSTVMNCSQK